MCATLINSHYFMKTIKSRINKLLLHSVMIKVKNQDNIFRINVLGYSGVDISSKIKNIVKIFFKQKDFKIMSSQVISSLVHTSPKVIGVWLIYRNKYFYNSSYIELNCTSLNECYDQALNLFSSRYKINKKHIIIIKTKILSTDEIKKMSILQYKSMSLKLPLFRNMLNNRSI
ncbi:ribosomal protein L18A (nucleomorph) [Bigelowiella natans]|uniref:Ribosomal protein L18A n=1 Tax=Bigelowiella natans TaxID=227086 RepID=Q3LWJ2_BIGNA|nr:ribosomal protein L18A [Bigelowiella natans]ABA27174.1 ribosomal protein L18A [Bigelowiella natans]